MAFFGLKKDKKEKKAAVDPVGKLSVASAAAPSATLKRPMVSEKALGLESSGRYSFQVSGASTKPEIKKEIEKLYGVKVTQVNTVTMKPRSVVFRGRTSYRPGFKKAVVKLAAGQKIEVMPK
ncbi:MAG: 50S ribosomal protein L23 [Patescibacteria group bacterium]